jgi:hypothetical protein
MKMKVSERRTRRMIDVVGVNMRERRLIKAQQEDQSAQNCSRNPHDYQDTLSDLPCQLTLI